MLKGMIARSVLDIPQLDGVITRASSKNILRCGMEQNMSDLAGMSSELHDRVDILGSGLFIGVECKVVWNLPDEDLAIVGAGGNERIVERRPVCVEDGGGVSAEEGDKLRETSALVQGDDGKGTTTTGFPIDGQVLRVDLKRAKFKVRFLEHKRFGDEWAVRGAQYLDDVAIPGILGDVQVIVASGAQLLSEIVYGEDNDRKYSKKLGVLQFFLGRPTENVA